MAIKLIVLDVDATLIDTPNVRSVSRRVRDAISAAIKKGVVVSIASGRNYSLIREYVQDLGLNGPCICCNGAAIMDDKQIYYQRGIRPETVLFCLEFAKRYDLMLAIFDGYQSYIVTSNNTEKIKARRDAESVKMIHCDFGAFAGLCSGSVYTITFVTETLSSMKDAVSHFLSLAESEGFPQEVEVDVSQASFNLNAFSITAKGVNKGSSLDYLAKLYGIKTEEILAIGDSGNDIAMIKAAGLGVAMGNGLQSLKDCADYVAPPVSEDGVAETIERFVLGQDR